MNRLSRLLLFVAGTSLPVVVIDYAHSQNSTATIIEPCDRGHCYQPGSIPLTLDDGSEVAFELEVAVPIISDDVVSVLPGTTIFVSGDVVEGKLINLSVVEEPKELREVLQVRMWQEPGMPDTFLVVTNHFHEIIKYRAAMLVPQADDFSGTSSCAVLGDGRVGYEHWPHAILQIALLDFAFIGTDLDELPCE
jgi:hypothetical protein